MKKFFQAAVAVKECVSLCYTAAMCIYLFFLFVFRRETAEWATLFSLLVVSAAAGTMQVMAFSDLLFKKLAYGWRLVVFVVPFGAILTACAVGFGWFPTGEARAWIEFAVIFLIIFLLFTASFELYYRLSGQKYDDRLDWYRKRKGTK